MAGSAAGGGVDRPIDPDRDALLAVLIRHGVAFVLIGGAAIQSHGGAYDTQDIDLAPSQGFHNTVRANSKAGQIGERLLVVNHRIISSSSSADAWLPSSMGGLSTERIGRLNSAKHS